MGIVTQRLDDVSEVGMGVAAVIGGRGDRRHALTTRHGCQRVAFAAGGRREVSPGVGRERAGAWPDRDDPGGVPSPRLAEPKVEDRDLLLGVEADHEDGAGGLDVVVGGSRHPRQRGQEVAFVGIGEPGPEIDVVGAERDAGVLGQGVGVLVGQA